MPVVCAALNIRAHGILRSKISHSQYVYLKQCHPVCNWKSEVFFAALFSLSNSELYLSIAGVHYELITTVCTIEKYYPIFPILPVLLIGRRGFFRTKNTITTTTASVIIDKHDLHSTWPIYSQPEMRHVFEEGTKLIVERSQRCYGPGDRMSVTATVRTESPRVTVIMLRSFEILLKETITFRGKARKKGETLTKTNIISGNMHHISTLMQEGMQETHDLFCILSSSHSNTTLTAARHIDITYVLIVKAILGIGPPLVVELPVIISNWKRCGFR